MSKDDNDSNVHAFPKSHAMVDKAYDHDGYVLENAASRITPIIGSYPMQFCLSLANPGTRMTEDANGGVITGTAAELSLIKDTLKQIDSGVSDADEKSRFSAIELAEFEALFSRHKTRGVWLIQLRNPAGRFWFNYSFDDQTALEVVGAIENYNFTPHK